MNNREYLYRYVETRYSIGVDEWGDPLPGFNLVVSLQSYLILRRTPKGTWIDCGYERFVRLNTRKKFACATALEAAESFRARKNRQIGILSAQLEQAKRALKLLDIQTNTEAIGNHNDFC